MDGNPIEKPKRKRASRAKVVPAAPAVAAPVEKRKPGRPHGTAKHVWTDRDVERASRMYGHGLTLEQIANIHGMHVTTLHKMLADDPTINTRLLKGKEICAKQVTDTAYALAVSGKCPTMTIFWLKCRQRWSEPKPVDDLPDTEGGTEFKLNYKE